MSGKLPHVGNNDRFPFRRRTATNTLSERDFKTAEAALVWPDAQELAGNSYPIEAGPEMSERMMDERSHRRHSSYVVVRAVQNRGSVSLQLVVSARLRNIA